MTFTSSNKFLCHLFNWSLEHGSVPSSFKSAYITPLLKKADLDPADVKSYRPISNFSIVSKLHDRLPIQSNLFEDTKIQSSTKENLEQVNLAKLA